MNKGKFLVTWLNKNVPLPGEYKWYRLDHRPFICCGLYQFHLVRTFPKTWGRYFASANEFDVACWFKTPLEAAMWLRVQFILSGEARNDACENP